jgi:hypothetical protein
VRLGTIQPGDIVRAGAMHALVLRKEGRILVVQGVCNGSVRRLRGGELDGHWRRAGARRKATA